jgi:hypothetical protein
MGKVNVQGWKNKLKFGKVDFLKENKSWNE